MSFATPWLLAPAVVLLVAAVLGYRALERRRRRAGVLRLSASIAAGPAGRADRPRRIALRRHLPYLLFLAALAVLLVGLARPTATVPTVRASGTVILAMDVSNSMTAKDVTPDRLAAAQQVAASFVRAQPDSVDIGVVAFGAGGLTTLQPTNDHTEVIQAVDRVQVGGSTSLGQAILTSLGAIAGHTVSLPKSDDATSSGAGGESGSGTGGAAEDEGQPEITAPPTGIGYRGDATIVLLSDGENTGGPDAQAAAKLAANAGVHIQAIGVGTEAGSVITVDGYQVATALNEKELTALASTTGGSYHALADAGDVSDIASSIDLRTQVVGKPVELTGLAAGIALLLLAVGAALMIRWHGRIV